MNKKAQALHFKALRSLCCYSIKPSGAWLYGMLRLAEARYHKLAEHYCNGEIGEADWSRDHRAQAGREMAEIFGVCPIGFFLNGDPRGYALKINPDNGQVPYGMHTDLGADGILAPELKYL